MRGRGRSVDRSLRAGDLPAWQSSTQPFSSEHLVVISDFIRASRSGPGKRSKASGLGKRSKASGFTSDLCDKASRVLFTSDGECFLRARSWTVFFPSPICSLTLSSIYFILLTANLSGSLLYRIANRSPLTAQSSRLLFYDRTAKTTRPNWSNFNPPQKGVSLI